MNPLRIKTRLNEEILRGLQRRATKRVVLLFSGGTDSTTSGILLKDQGFEVYPLFVDYGQAAGPVERYAVERLSKRLGFHTPCVYSLPDLLQLGLVQVSADQRITDNQAWVPGRNTLLMVLAGIYGVRTDADGLAIGYCLADNFVFGDNDLLHHQALGLVLTRSFARPFDVLLPIKALSKCAVITIVRERGVLADTVSCWNAALDGEQIIACGRCANCLERTQAEGGSANGQPRSA